MAITFPAFCPSCGLIFQSHLLGFAPGAVVHNLVLEDNRESCPRCGAWAELPDGTFNVVDDTIHVLSASKLTRERLAQLVDILDAARKGEITEEQAAERAPELAPLFEKYRPLMRRALIAFLWFVFQTAATQHFTHAATPQDVQKAVQAAIQRCVREAP